MTPEIAVMPEGVINRFEVFHHERKRNPLMWNIFAEAMHQIMHSPATPDVVPARWLRDTLSKDYPWVYWTINGVDVFKAMMAWYRHKNPEMLKRFRHRRTEKGRGLPTNIDWAAQSRMNVSDDVVRTLAELLHAQRRMTTMTLLKRDAGVRFNQNYNAEVAKRLHMQWPTAAKYLPRRRRVVR